MSAVIRCIRRGGHAVRDRDAGVPVFICGDGCEVLFVCDAHRRREHYVTKTVWPMRFTHEQICTINGNILHQGEAGYPVSVRYLGPLLVPA